MSRMLRPAAVLAAVALVCALNAAAAPQWIVGGNSGLSFFEGTAGFHLGPMAEFPLGKDLSVGSELSLNTQGGTPILWYSYAKYHFLLSGSRLRPYGDGGLLLDFSTGGPYFGLLFGGGVNIPVGNRLWVAPELQAGPLFSVGGGTVRVGPFVYDVKGTTVFVLLLRGGIRYEL
ncbi:MAG: hypothetical protein WB626_07650 [Bacteroidota bacterium]